MATVEARRAALVAEALSWTGTPYVSNGRVKGKQGGVDCLMFLVGAFENAAEIPHLEIPHYPPDWHLHQTKELFLDGMDGTPGLRHWCDEVERAPLPGDILMVKFGHCYSHGAIVVKWPIVVHAYCRRPVGRDDAERTSVLSRIHESIPLRGQPRPRKFFTLKSWI